MARLERAAISTSSSGGAALANTASPSPYAAAEKATNAKVRKCRQPGALAKANANVPITTSTAQATSVSRVAAFIQSPLYVSPPAPVAPGPRRAREKLCELTRRHGERRHSLA